MLFTHTTATPPVFEITTKWRSMCGAIPSLISIYVGQNPITHIENWSISNLMALIYCYTHNILYWFKALSLPIYGPPMVPANRFSFWLTFIIASSMKMKPRPTGSQWTKVDRVRFFAVVVVVVVFCFCGVCVYVSCDTCGFAIGARFSC